MNRRYLAWVTIDGDWNVDRSRAVVFTPWANTINDLTQTLTARFSDSELQRIWQDLRLIRYEFQKRHLIKLAKDASITYEQILQELRNYIKKRILWFEWGKIRHYHRTSLDNFKNIIKEGSLLSRSKLQEKYPDIEIPAWSSRDEVMMTRDKYNQNGELKMLWFGFYDQNIWSWSGIVLIFNSTIMDRDDYDHIGQYPMISELPLREYCDMILAKDQKTFDELQKLLEENDFDIKIQLISDWKDENIVDD